MYDIKVRNVRREELDEVIRVEQEAWPAELMASKDKFESRLNVFPDGFFGKIEFFCQGLCRFFFVD